MAKSTPKNSRKADEIRAAMCRGTGDDMATNAPRSERKSAKARNSVLPFGPRSRASRLARIDRRTAEAHVIEGFRAGLIAHLGGDDAITMPQRVLIDTASTHYLRIQLADRDCFEQGKPLPRDYAGWTRALCTILAKLGIDDPAKPTSAAPAKRLTPAQRYAQRRAERAQAAV